MARSLQSLSGMERSGKRNMRNHGSNDEKRQVFETAVVPHMNDLLNRARSYVRCQQDAEDLVQEALLRAYTGWHTFVPGTSCRNWLLKILHNVFVSRYRRGKLESAWLRERGAVVDALHSGARDRTHASPERRTAERVLRGEVHTALSQLPPEFRQVLELRCLKGGSYRSIAQALSIPVGTVMSRLHRARRQLRSAVERRLIRRPTDNDGLPPQLVDACLLAA